MNKVGCKCLNIIIESELHFSNVDKDQLELTIEESEDSFFQNVSIIYFDYVCDSQIGINFAFHSISLGYFKASGET